MTADDTIYKPLYSTREYAERLRAAAEQGASWPAPESAGQALVLADLLTPTPGLRAATSPGSVLGRMSACGQRLTTGLQTGALGALFCALAVGLTPLRRAMNNHRKDLK